MSPQARDFLWSTLMPFAIGMFAFFIADVLLHWWILWALILGGLVFYFGRQVLSPIGDAEIMEFERHIHFRRAQAYWGAAGATGVVAYLFLLMFHWPSVLTVAGALLLFHYVVNPIVMRYFEKVIRYNSPNVRPLMGQEAMQEKIKAQQKAKVQQKLGQEKVQQGQEETKIVAPIFWGGIEYDEAVLPANFFVMGIVGSGKTLTIRMLLQDLLPQIGTHGAIGTQGGLPFAFDSQPTTEGAPSTEEPHEGHRALIYDGKRELVPYIYGVEGVQESRIHLLNPFDKRCSYWDVSSDIDSVAHAQEIANIVIPADTGQNRFFTDAARLLLAGVIEVFVYRKLQGQLKSWSLRDVILAFDNRNDLATLLASNTSTSYLNPRFVLDKATFDKVAPSASTYLAPFRVLAALWENQRLNHIRDGVTDRNVSIREWIEGEYIYVMTHSHQISAAVNNFYQFFFKSLSQNVLDKADAKTRRTWIIIDEARQASRFEGLGPILTMGRSKGVCTVLGFQAIEGMQEVYGEKIASELAGMCRYKVFLKQGSEISAHWASAQFSDMRHGQETSYVVPVRELLALPIPDGKKWGINGRAICEFGAHEVVLSPKDLSKRLQSESDKEVHSVFHDRSANEQLLPYWTVTERVGLGLPPKPVQDAPTKNSGGSGGGAQYVNS
jgi:hypothetical protein